MNIHFMRIESKNIYDIFLYFAASGRQVNRNWYKDKHCAYNFESMGTRTKDLDQQQIISPSDN